MSSWCLRTFLHRDIDCVRFLHLFTKTEYDRLKRVLVTVKVGDVMRQARWTDREVREHAREVSRFRRSERRLDFIWGPYTCRESFTDPVIERLVRSLIR